MKQRTNGSMPLREYLTDRYQLRHQTASSKAILVYGSAINRFGTYLDREPLLMNLTVDSVLLFMRWTKDSGRSSATANNYAKVLVILWKDAYRSGAYDQRPPENGDIPKLREPKRIPTA